MKKATMHCQSELEEDLGYDNFLPDQVLMKWFNDTYSSSKHLLTLYSIAKGLKAKNILEIGFGRSSFVLARAAFENNGRLITCDTRDFSYLLNSREKMATTFVHNTSDHVWPLVEKTGVDFAFLDYFSDENLSKSFVVNQIKTCLKYIKGNGIIAIHDTLVNKYVLSEIFNPGTFNTLLKKRVELITLPYNYGLGLLRQMNSNRYKFINDNFNVKKSEN